ncbi:hypothetical protein [Coprobacter fastidiosus]|jgi:hypothetical protein|uniref:hypothetical protein n=1 Tax=Coprobacter fastidiosus TaxID=1099853 RepID=UPI000240ED15|nr:hypothetical protein [Coprobacter fastidiosus]EHL85191.1 hypothetical protein HMPREF1033_01652 [Tannerella sp. 6_1_58FAA_CT1]PWM12734.1 MAG: hypothetical protein DBY02_00290 [Coprobacter fastidiosus]RHO54470.1 hypothetical protein DW107_10225 [Tannerella sp. AM09-19]
MKTLKLFVLVILLTCVNSITIVSLGQRQLSVLPKNAKWKTVKYKADNYLYFSVGTNLYYAISCYVANNEFVAGQKMTLMNMSMNGYLQDTIASGIYLRSGLDAYLEGNIYKNDNGRISTFKGTIKISNDETGRELLANKRKATALKIEVDDIVEYSDYYGVSYRTDSGNKYGLIGYGEKKCPLTLTKRLDDNYELKIMNLDKIDSLTAIVTLDTITKYGFLSFDDFIEKSNHVKLKYKNGDVFIGSVKKKKDYYSNIWKPDEGEYKYNAGEVYKGKINDYKWNDLFYAPDTAGVTIFTNGVTVSGDWWADFNLTSEEWSEITNHCKNLTEVRNEAIRYSKKKKEKELAKKQAKQREKAKKRAEEQAKRRYYIQKYGSKWGELVYKKEITLGMTKAMCCDIIDKRFYNISYVGNSEYWFYGKIEPFLEALGVFSILVELPQELVFKNNILIGFTK